MARVDLGHDGVGVTLCQLFTGREHPCRDEINPVREIRRAMIPPVRDLRIEYGVTMT